jgi:hypothetical protein
LKSIQLGFLVVAMTLLSSMNSFSQNANDFSAWSSIQLYYYLNKANYVSFQYQNRFNENASRFDNSNLYFIYGHNFNKKNNLEVYYRLQTNYQEDVHTLFWGYNRKIKFKNFNLYARVAMQHNRNYFSFNESYDRSFTEARFRLRAKYDINKIFSTTLSAEPTIELNGPENPYVDKIRYVAQLSMQYNKYQSFTLFYFYQPDLHSFSIPEANYVLGLNYEVILPSKSKSYKKLFKLDLKSNDENDSGNKNHPDNQ